MIKCFCLLNLGAVRFAWLYTCFLLTTLTHSTQGVDYVFVDHPSFPRPGGLYSDEFGVFGDNQVREQESGCLSIAKLGEKGRLNECSR